MRDVSNEFNHAAMNGRVVARVECTPASGSGVEFGPQDVMQGGISVTSATSNSGSFGIGCAVIGRCTIRLRNDHRQLNGLNLSGARVVPYVGASVDGEIEWLKLGTYYVEPFDAYDDIVSLTCLDALSKLEVPCPDLSECDTLGDIVATVCDGIVTLETPTFPNNGYTINEMPDLSSKSRLDVLAYVAQVAGCYVIADEDGGVHIEWYSGVFVESDLDGGGFHFEVDDADGGGFHFEVDYYSGGLFFVPYSVDALKSFSTSVASHQVTGLAVSDVDGTQYVAGSDGYVLHIRDNPLIESGRAQDVARNMAQRMLGMNLRSVKVTTPGSPAMEAGDPVTVVDRFGEKYNFWATSVTWSATGTLTMACDVESSSPLVRTFRRSSAGGSSVDVPQVENIINNTLDKPLTDLTGITSFGDINTAISGINSNIGSGYDHTTSGTIGDRLTNLENSTSVGQWIIQVNGVAQTTGTINFVT